MDQPDPEFQASTDSQGFDEKLTLRTPKVLQPTPEIIKEQQELKAQPASPPAQNVFQMPTQQQTHIPLPIEPGKPAQETSA